jgi:hypothetical protein
MCACMLGKASRSNLKAYFYIIYSFINYTFWDYFNDIKIYISNLLIYINKVIK